MGKFVTETELIDFTSIEKSNAACVFDESHDTITIECVHTIADACLHDMDVSDIHTETAHALWAILADGELSVTSKCIPKIRNTADPAVQNENRYIALTQKEWIINRDGQWHGGKLHL